MLLPVALRLRGRRVLVVGGGAVAARKARACLEAGAHVTAIAPEFSPDFPSCPKHTRVFQSGDCEGYFLVFAATNNRKINALIASQALLCNIADDPQNSDLHTASVIRRGEIAIGVTTGATSPILARFVKSRIESAVPPALETLLSWVASYDIAPQKRGALWREILQSEMILLLENGDSDAAQSLLREVVGRV